MFPAIGGRSTAMPTRNKKAQAGVVAAAEAEPEAICPLLDEWPRIETEHTNLGFVLPDREAVVAWSEKHPVTVLAAASFAIWGPVLGAITFG
jgi:hypothetical protein